MHELRAPVTILAQHPVLYAQDLARCNEPLDRGNRGVWETRSLSRERDKDDTEALIAASAWNPRKTRIMTHMGPSRPATRTHRRASRKSGSPARPHPSRRSRTWFLSVFKSSALGTTPSPRATGRVAGDGSTPPWPVPSGESQLVIVAQQRLGTLRGRARNLEGRDGVHGRVLEETIDSTVYSQRRGDVMP